MQRVFKKYATFSGRASRAEYWWWALVGAVVGVVLNIIVSVGMVTTTTSYAGTPYATPTPGPLSVVGYILLVVWGLAVIVPSLALTVRRLHDVNMSGWMILGLHAVSPEDFLLDQLDLDPMGTVELLREPARDKRRPPVTVEDVLGALGRAGAPRFSAAVATLLQESGS